MKTYSLFLALFFAPFLAQAGSCPMIGGDYLCTASDQSFQISISLKDLADGQYLLEDPLPVRASERGEIQLIEGLGFRFTTIGLCLTDRLVVTTDQVVADTGISVASIRRTYLRQSPTELLLSWIVTSPSGSEYKEIFCALK